MKVILTQNVSDAAGALVSVCKCPNAMWALLSKNYLSMPSNRIILSYALFSMLQLLMFLTCYKSVISLSLIRAPFVSLGELILPSLLSTGQFHNLQSVATECSSVTKLFSKASYGTEVNATVLLSVTIAFLLFSERKCLLPFQKYSLLQIVSKTDCLTNYPSLYRISSICVGLNVYLFCWKAPKQLVKPSLSVGWKEQRMMKVQLYLLLFALIHSRQETKKLSR